MPPDKEHLHEDFASFEEAQAFQQGLTYGDELNWISPSIEILVDRNDIVTGFRAHFDRPEEYEDGEAG